MRNTAIRTIAAITALLCSVGVATAATRAATRQGADTSVDAGALPAEKQEGSISYVSGGIGLGQSTQFQRARSRYPLTVEVFERTGGYNQYTADAQLKISGNGNVAFETQTDGPFTLIRIPPGSYRVEVTYQGRTKSKQVQVRGNGSARATLVFADQPDDEPQPQRRRR